LSQNSLTMTDKPKRVRKAVFPAAGLGTRFLPATKAQPKEMLPIVDKPLIQYSVEECAASGIEDIIVVTGRGKASIEDHFDRSPELEQFLRQKGDTRRADLVRDVGAKLRFSYIRQREPLGLGHAVLVARELVGDEPFAVLLGDVICDGAEPVTRELCNVYEATGIGAIAVEPVPRELVHLYGIIDARPANEPKWGERLRQITNLVEKPEADKAPSNLSVIGRYVLPPEVFDCLERTEPGRGGEIQLTDGLRMLAREHGLWALTTESKTYDAGDKLGFLKATVEFAVKNTEFGEEFRAYLKSLKL
jgi:UTP--glucose-1-phosphate uridylyltransferase